MRLHSIAFALSLSGCIGSYQSGMQQNQNNNNQNNQNNNNQNTQPTPKTARQLFDANVAPTLSSTCATCHAGTPPTDGPTFLGSGPTMFYASLVADARFVNAVPAKSELITKGKHEGPALTTQQSTDFLAWLTQETVERTNLPQPPPPTDQVQLQLAAFGNCMSQTDFDSTGMNDLQNQTTVGNAGSCYSCHSTGMYVYLSTDSNANEQHLQRTPWLLKFAQASTNPDGTFLDIVPANRFRDRGSETGHPQYTLSDARLSALTNFFMLTYNKWKAGNCPAPGM